MYRLRVLPFLLLIILFITISVLTNNTWGIALLHIQTANIPNTLTGQGVDILLMGLYLSCPHQHQRTHDHDL